MSFDLKRKLDTPSDPLPKRLNHSSHRPPNPGDVLSFSNEAASRARAAGMTIVEGDFREEFGKWGEWGEWGDEEVAETKDDRSDEEFKRQWEKYWAKVPTDSWRRERVDRSLHRRGLADGDVYATLEGDSIMGSKKGNNDSECTRLLVAFETPVDQNMALKALSVRMAEYGVVEHCEFIEETTAAIYFVEQVDAERARRDLDGELLEILDRKSGTKGYEMNIDRVQKVNRRRGTVIWAGPVLQPSKTGNGLQPAQLAQLFEQFGECVCVLRRASTAFGVLHARYRYRTDAVAALVALQQRFREDWDILSGFAMRPTSPKLPNLEFPKDLRLNKWYRGVAMKPITTTTEVSDTPPHVDIGLDGVECLLINERPAARAQLPSLVEGTLSDGDEVMCRVIDVQFRSSGPQLLLSRRSDYGWPVKFSALQAVIEKGDWFEALLALLAYRMGKHSLGFFLTDVMAGRRQFDAALQCATRMDQLKYYRVDTSSGALLSVPDMSRPCEMIPIPQSILTPPPPLTPFIPPSAIEQPMRSPTGEASESGPLFPAGKPTLRSPVPVPDAVLDEKKRREEIERFLRDIEQDGNFRHAIAKFSQEHLIKSEWDIELKGIMEQLMQKDPEITYDDLVERGLAIARRAISSEVKIEVLKFSMREAQIRLAKALPAHPPPSSQPSDSQIAAVAPVPGAPAVVPMGFAVPLMQTPFVVVPVSPLD